MIQWNISNTYAFIMVDVFHARLEPAQTNLWWAGKELRTPMICWIRAKVKNVPHWFYWPTNRVLIPSEIHWCPCQVTNLMRQTCRNWFCEMRRGGLEMIGAKILKYAESWLSLVGRGEMFRRRLGSSIQYCIVLYAPIRCLVDCTNLQSMVHGIVSNNIKLLWVCFLFRSQVSVLSFIWDHTKTYSRRWCAIGPTKLWSSTSEKMCGYPDVWWFLTLADLQGSVNVAFPCSTLIRRYLAATLQERAQKRNV